MHDILTSKNICNYRLKCSKSVRQVIDFRSFETIMTYIFSSKDIVYFREFSKRLYFCSKGLCKTSTVALFFLSSMSLSKFSHTHLTCSIFHLLSRVLFFNPSKIMMPLLSFSFIWQCSTMPQHSMVMCPGGKRVRSPPWVTVRACYFVSNKLRAFSSSLF